MGSCEAYQAFVGQLDRVAGSDASVLLAGESGSGKGAAARRLHAFGARASGPYVAVHLAAVAESLIESELFGHERGAFTDAREARAGTFRRAEGGTIVLDDIDALPLPQQVKLLRVLQERVVEPVGAEASVPIDVRVVATTNRDLMAEVEAGRFREDLYYRLAVVTLEVPPLRARREDLPALAEFILQRLAKRLKRDPRRLSAAALERLRLHPWPGNVRELENALERVLVLGPAPASGAQAQPRAALPIEAEELDFLDEAVAGRAEELALAALAGGLTIDAIGLAMMRRAMEEQRGNVSAAARQLGLTRRALEYRLEREPGPTAESSESAKQAK